MCPELGAVAARAGQCWPFLLHGSDEVWDLHRDDDIQGCLELQLLDENIRKYYSRICSLQISFRPIFFSPLKPNSTIQLLIKHITQCPSNYEIPSHVNELSGGNKIPLKNKVIFCPLMPAQSLSFSIKRKGEKFWTKWNFIETTKILKMRNRPLRKKKINIIIFLSSLSFNRDAPTSDSS